MRSHLFTLLCCYTHLCSKSSVFLVIVYRRAVFPFLGLSIPFRKEDKVFLSSRGERSKCKNIALFLTCCKSRTIEAWLCQPLTHRRCAEEKGAHRVILLLSLIIKSRTSDFSSESLANTHHFLSCQLAMLS